MDHIEVTRAEGLAEVVLNRPKVNAMSSQLLVEMHQVFTGLADDDAVKGLLLRGQGKCLSAGLDLKEVASLDPAAAEAFLDRFDAAFTAAFRFPKPLAVAVTGHAIAGGLVLALCADYIALGKGAHQHGLTELAVGVPFPRVALEIVKYGTHGRGRRTLIYGAGTHPPEQLYAWGIGDSLDEAPIDAARAWLQLVTSRPAATFRMVKASDRQQAWARIDAQPLAERRQIISTLLATRQDVLG